MPNQAFGGSASKIIKGKQGCRCGGCSSPNVRFRSSTSPTSPAQPCNLLPSERERPIPSSSKGRNHNSFSVSCILLSCLKAGTKDENNPDITCREKEELWSSSVLDSELGSKNEVSTTTMFDKAQVDGNIIRT